jgi:hypothetical protein
MPRTGKGSRLYSGPPAATSIVCDASKTPPKLDIFYTVEKYFVIILYINPNYLKFPFLKIKNLLCLLNQVFLPQPFGDKDR